MGFVYAGCKTNNSVNAYAKIGETNRKYLSSRIGEIRHSEGNFVVLYYIEIKDSTPAMTKAIEGHMRFLLEKAGYVNTQNDHFVWKTNKNVKMQEYETFAKMAIDAACEYCDFMGIKYELKTGKPNARKTVQRRG